MFVCSKEQSSNPKYVEVTKKGAGFITGLLAVALIATASAYLISKFVSERTYRKKWEDYDDCGLA